MTEVSTFRLYLLRATYLLIVVGLGISIWPDLIHHAIAGDPTPRATPSLLAGVCVMAALGIRYPLQMLPLLLFELAWKSIWLIAVGLPLVRPSNRCGYLGDGQGLPDGHCHLSDRDSVGLCVFELREETWRQVEVRRLCAHHRSARGVIKVEPRREHGRHGRKRSNQRQGPQFRRTAEPGDNITSPESPPPAFRRC